MITLYQYLEDLILKCIKDNMTNAELYRAIIENKHSTAVCGSREDVEWLLVLLAILYQISSKN